MSNLYHPQSGDYGERAQSFSNDAVESMDKHANWEASAAYSLLVISEHLSVIAANLADINRTLNQ